MEVDAAWGARAALAGNSTIQDADGTTGSLASEDERPDLETFSHEIESFWLDDLRFNSRGRGSLFYVTSFDNLSMGGIVSVRSGRGRMLERMSDPLGGNAHVPALNDSASTLNRIKEPNCFVLRNGQWTACETVGPPQSVYGGTRQIQEVRFDVYGPHSFFPLEELRMLSAPNPPRPSTPVSHRVDSDSGILAANVFEDGMRAHVLGDDFVVAANSTFSDFSRTLTTRSQIKWLCKRFHSSTLTVEQLQQQLRNLRQDSRLVFEHNTEFNRLLDLIHELRLVHDRDYSQLFQGHAYPMRMEFREDRMLYLRSIRPDIAEMLYRWVVTRILRISLINILMRMRLV